ncbi:hypothetical protein BB561_002995 [Smittium simulii]|uniref:UBA domain-containing protein n=1 Tax=Smittium simulii TaxID=133385 RepID=A0A2T9YNC1_9FUNG|nr:hypothetical protein BB561_002995 [Smittium simulii]
MPEITLNIKGTNEIKFTVSIDPATTSVLQLKESIESLDSSIPKDSQPNPFGANNDIFSLLGGMGDMGPMSSLANLPPVSPEIIETMYSNPHFQQTAQQILSNPDMINSMINSNPAISSQITPEMRQAMSNPEFMRAMTNPEVIRASMQMQAALNGTRGSNAGAQPSQQQQFGSTLYNPWAPTQQQPTQPTTDSNTAASDQQASTPQSNPFAALLNSGLMNPGAMGNQPPSADQIRLMQQMLGPLNGNAAGAAPPFGLFSNAPPATAAPAVSSVPPEERFSVQLAQLNEMGFWDAPKNIRALLATGGNVNAAIEMLLSEF